ncbi:TPA: Ig-like domain-containing protein, partial [Yersinia enterocolitica]
VPVTFVSAGPAYNLAYEILSNNAPANGSTPNQVRFTLRNNTTNQPVSNQLLIFTASDTAVVTPQNAYTDINGQVTVNVTSNVQRLQDVTARLQSEPTVMNSVILNFMNTYPIRHEIPFTIGPGIYSIGYMLNDSILTLNHRYTVEFYNLSSLAITIGKCPPQTHFNPVVHGCDLGASPDIEALPNGDTRIQSDFIALKTGISSEFLMNEYVYKTLGENTTSTVILTDYGPQPRTLEVNNPSCEE